MFQGHDLNKRHRLAGHAAASLGVALFFTAPLPAIAQRAGTNANTSAYSPNAIGVRGVGARSPLATFGRVGGDFTSDWGNTPSSVNRGLPQQPYARAQTQLQVGYTATNGLGVSGSQLNASLVRNSQAARQLFGDRAATSLLGRTTGSGIGSNLDVNPPPLRRTSRGSTYIPGYSPASLSLDRGLLLRTNSNLARLATGPRESFATLAARGDEDPFTLNASKDDSDRPAALSSQDTQGLTFEQRQKQRVDKEFLDCIDRGDEAARAGDIHRARASYQRARIINSDDASPCFRLFVACMLTRDVSQAFVYLRQGLARAHSAEQLKISLADCTASIQDLRKIQSEIDKELRSTTPNAIQHAVLSYLSFVLEDPGAARKEAQAALKVAPNSSELEKLARFVETRNIVPSGG